MTEAMTSSSHLAASLEWRRNSFWKLLDVGSANALRLVLTVVFARRLGVNEFGMYALAIMVVGIAVTVSNVGLPTAASKFLAEARSEQPAQSRLAALVR